MKMLSYMKAEFHGKIGRTKEALKALNEPPEVDPKRADAWLWKGRFPGGIVLL